MPPRDPRLCPALERSLPGDSGTFNGYRADSSRHLALFGDGEYHPVQVRAWWTDRHGGRVVQVQWSADGSTWQESYAYDAGKAREA